MNKFEFFLRAAIGGAVLGAAIASLPPSIFQSASERRAVETSVYYAGCDEVRASGKAPLRAGEPGYRDGMDGDGDGVACEPHF